MGITVLFEKFIGDLEGFCYEYIETYAYKEKLLNRGELLLVRKMMDVLLTGLNNKYKSSDVVDLDKLLSDVKFIYQGYVNAESRLSVPEELLLDDLLMFIDVNFKIIEFR